MLNLFNCTRTTLRTVCARSFTDSFCKSLNKYNFSRVCITAGSILTSTSPPLFYASQSVHCYSWIRVSRVHTTSSRFTSNCPKIAMSPTMSTKFNYPKARRDETAVDIYHGKEVRIKIHNNNI
jgi:hypothetical protein